MSFPRCAADWQALDDKRVSAQKLATDKIASELLGVRAECADAIYTQHPLMAGVLREALKRAYMAGYMDSLMAVLEAPVSRPPSP